MEFVIRTVYTYDHLVRFNDFFAKSKKALWGTVIGCNIFILALVSFYFALLGFDSNMLFYLILMLIITGVMILRLFVIPRFSLKKSKLLDAVCTVTFSDEQIEIHAESAHSTETGNLKYSAICKVMEDEQCFYIFRSKNQANLIDKDGFITGNIDDFREFLRGKIEPKKFKCK